MAVLLPLDFVYAFGERMYFSPGADVQGKEQARKRQRELYRYRGCARPGLERLPLTDTLPHAYSFPQLFLPAERCTADIPVHPLASAASACRSELQGTEEESVAVITGT